LARALLHGPELLFLDEPTSDLDPEAAKQVQDLILEVSGQKNRTVLLCTHRLHEAERLCTRVAIMRAGVVMATGSLDDLRREIMPDIRVEIRFASPPAEELRAQIASLPGVQQCTQPAAEVMHAMVDSEDRIPGMVESLVKSGASVRAVVPQQASLEEIYLRLQQNEEVKTR